MRTILLKWLMQVGPKFQVKHETIQICVQLVDLVLLFETNRISRSTTFSCWEWLPFCGLKIQLNPYLWGWKYIYLCDGLYNLPPTLLNGKHHPGNHQLQHAIPNLALVHWTCPSTLPNINGTNGESTSQAFDVDFMLCNRFQKQHLSAVIIYFALKLNESSSIRSKDIIDELKVPESIFKECFNVLLGPDCLKSSQWLHFNININLASTFN